MENKGLLSNAIKEIIELRGSLIFEDSKMFCAMIDDLVPGLGNERRIFRSILNDKVLAEIGRLYAGTSVGQNTSWARIKLMIVEDYGFQSEWCDVVIDSFSKAINSLVLDKLYQNAEKGDVKALSRLSEMYKQRDKSIERDSIKIFQWFEKVAKQGDVEFQCVIAHMYNYGHGTEKNEQKALEWYGKAAEQGNMDAQFELGKMYYGSNYSKIEKDYVKSFMWYKKAAEQGHIGAQRSLGDMYMMGEVIEKDYIKAMEWYKKAAEQGDSYSQIWLGYIYYSGKGTEKNSEKALEWYKKAVTAEYGISFRPVIMYMYEKEGETRRDIMEAFEWYKRAAEQGHAPAQWAVAQIYDGIEDFLPSQRLRKVIDRDCKKALEWLQKAADQGDGGALSSMGNMYYYGRGVEKDHAKAFLLYEKAVEKGYVHAQTDLARMYEKGEGTRKDIDAALHWYRKAAEWGNSDAKKKLKEYGIS